MSNQLKISLTWLILGLSLVMFSAMEVMEEIYFTATSERGFIEQTRIPTMVHTIFISTMILPMIMSFVTVFTANKIFKWVSLVFAILLVLVNAGHVYAVGDVTNISQMLLLIFVVIANVFLVVSLKNWLKEG